MLKKFALWFICFGLSFLVESFGWTEQGRAFLYIECGTIGVIIALLVLVCLFGGSGALERFGLPMSLLIIYAVSVGIALFATWGATKLFDVDFFVAYQMDLGQVFRHIFLRIYIFLSKLRLGVVINIKENL